MFLIFQIKIRFLFVENYIFKFFHKTFFDFDRISTKILRTVNCGFVYYRDKNIIFIKLFRPKKENNKNRKKLKMHNYQTDKIFGFLGAKRQKK